LNSEKDMEIMEESQVEYRKYFKKYGRKASWIVKTYGKYGRNHSRMVKIFWKYGRKAR
jgi:hypothetical protein